MSYCDAKKIYAIDVFDFFVINMDIEIRVCCGVMCYWKEDRF
jgi:hypothetical protein